MISHLATENTKSRTLTVRFVWLTQPQPHVGCRNGWLVVGRLRFKGNLWAIRGDMERIQVVYMYGFGISEVPLSDVNMRIMRQTAIGRSCVCKVGAH